MNSTALSRRQGITLLFLAGLVLMLALVLVNLFRLAPSISLHPAAPTAAPALVSPASVPAARDAAPPPAVKPAPSQAPSGTSTESNPNPPNQPGSGAPNYLQDAGEGSTNPPPAYDQCLKIKCGS
jgi:hypothetical protein